VAEVAVEEYVSDAGQGAEKQWTWMLIPMMKMRAKASGWG
jgi:hypothetical protein